MGFLVYIRGRVSVKRCCVLREALCPTDDMSMLTQTFFTGAETNRTNTQSAQVPESCNYNLMARLFVFQSFLCSPLINLISELFGGSNTLNALVSIAEAAFSKQ